MERTTRKFVIRWTKALDQDFVQDRRGWPKGKRRRYSLSEEKRIKKIHHQLKEDPEQFYVGATIIQDKYRKQYSNSNLPSLRTIGRILSALGLSEKRRRGRNKGASRYLCYPEYTIYHLLGGRVLETDFIGKKYITGRTKPLNFIGFSFKKEPKLRYFKRIEGQTAENFIKQSRRFFKKFEEPDFMKVDNSLAAIGSASGKRNVSQAMKFLLKNQVVPIFTVPRKPFSQASIEGNNSVFARKFWNRIDFKSIREIDKKLDWFNKSSREYTGYQPPRAGAIKIRKKNFIPRIYFIRQTKEDMEQTGKAFIDILNEKVFLPSSYINYFVLAEWNLRQEKLRIYFEKEQNPRIIKTLPFKINPRSKRGCSHSYD